MGVEPTTTALATQCSTAELHPRVISGIIRRTARRVKPGHGPVEISSSLRGSLRAEASPGRPSRMPCRGWARCLSGDCTPGRGRSSALPAARYAGILSEACFRSSVREEAVRQYPGKDSDPIAKAGTGCDSRSRAPSGRPLWERAIEVVAKFLGSAVFGLLVSWIILDLGLGLVNLHGAPGGIWLALLWITPLIWGVLGVFYFDKALDFALKLWKSYFGFDR